MSNDKSTIILVVLLIFIAVFAPQIQDIISATGEAVYKGTTSDTDGGLNYNIKGTACVGGAGGKWAKCASDYCKNSNTLVEYYVIDTIKRGAFRRVIARGFDIASKLYTCPNGCLNGACKAPGCTPTSGQETKETSCTDSLDNDCDAKIDISDPDCVAQTYSCTGAIPANADLCTGDETGLTVDTQRTLVLWCTNTKKCEYVCKSEYFLLGGICEAIYCTDSDGGKVYGIKGETCSNYGYPYPQGCLSDSCNITSGKINELYCDATYPIRRTEHVACPSGQTCQDGICV